MEVSQSNLEVLLDTLTDLLSLSNELVGVVAGNDGLEDFIDDRWKHSSIVVHTEVPIDIVDSLWVWSEQDSQVQVDGLQIFRASGTLDGLWMGPYIIDNWSFKDWKLHVPTFPVNCILHSCEGVKLHGTVSWLDIVDCTLEGGDGSEESSQYTESESQLLLIVHCV